MSFLTYPHSKPRYFNLPSASLPSKQQKQTCQALSSKLLVASIALKVGTTWTALKALYRVAPTLQPSFCFFFITNHHHHTCICPTQIIAMDKFIPLALFLQ